jgi:uncharacterized protein
MDKRVKEHGIELLVIQPTPFCNLDCSYCYLPHRDSTRRISPEVLRRTFEQVFASRWARGPLTVVWHAGEPLVLPLGFYRDAFALADELNATGLDLSHSFQTNGTLIDASWCELITRHRVRIGVSVDGPAAFHDAHRKTRTGQGTHDRVMRGIHCLQEHGVEFHVISVLTRESLDHPDDLFRFYVENGIRRVGFNIEEIEGINTSSSLEAERAAERVRSFFTRFLELTLASRGQLEVRELSGLGKLILEGSGLAERNQENTPMHILNVDWMGNFSTFSPELLGVESGPYGDFLLGNVLRDDLDAVESTPKFRHIVSEVEAGIAECRRTCEYFGVCGGGSPSNKYFETGSLRSTETLHCRLSKKALTEVVLANLEAALDLTRPVI